MSDLGNAERFVDQMDEWGTQVLYCQAWRKWMCWDKSRWAVDDNNSVRGLLSKSVRSMHNKVNPHDPEDDQKKFARFIQKSENAKSFDNILSQVRHLTPVKTGQLDKNPWLLNCKNGTINLRTGELRKPNRNDLVTKHTPIGYGNRDDECPMWEEYLDIVTGGDRDLQRFLQMAAGYTLSGMTSEQCFFVLYGRGKNGKSTFIEVLAMILGEDYATTASMDSFMEKRYETIRNDLAAMKGMRMVSAVEANQGQKLDEALIKSVTGGDRVSARFMRGEFFSYKPEFKLWLGVNDRPRIGGDDEGIWRRIRLVPFTHAIPVEKRKKDFPERLRRAGELPAIMRWAVEGCLAWLKTGDLNSPESVEAATEEYREEQDIMGTWMRQRCAVGPDYEIASKTLYDDYRDWASENGHRSYSMTNFVTRLKERGFSTRRTNRARFLVGMTLTTPSDD